ncbi:MAG: hypothetical protein R3A13_06915 [Bdellovibrionota bacterium]
MLSPEQKNPPEPEKIPLHALLRREAVADIIKCGTTGWSRRLEGITDKSLKALKEEVEAGGYLSFESAGIDKETADIVVNFQATLQFFEKFKDQIADAWVAWCNDQTRGSWSCTHSELHLPLRPEVSRIDNPAVITFVRHRRDFRMITSPLVEVENDGLSIRSNMDAIGARVFRQPN